MKTVDVYVNIPVKSIARSYTYRVPDGLSKVGVGWRVIVPFGGRRVEGFVLGEHEPGEIGDASYEMKDIVGTADDEAWFTPQMIEAARWLSEFYLCSLAEMMRLFMPGKSGVVISVRYSALPSDDDMLSAEPYASIHAALSERGALTAGEIKKALPDLMSSAGEYDEAINDMLRRKWIKKEYAASAREKIRYEEIFSLKCEPSDELLSSYNRKRAQKKLIELLRDGGRTGAELKSLGVSRAVIKAVKDDGLLAVTRRRIFRDSYHDHSAGGQSAGVLTEEQRAALDAVIPSVRNREGGTFLLHGVTGSGKTRVYIEAARVARLSGREVIVLVPEIGLTGQLVSSFKQYFPDDIITIHSRLTLAERNDAFGRIRRGESGIVIGARSALFTPMTNLGLIVMDEEQDMSYKQDEAPRYSARVVAAELARIHGATLLLGSATPSFETYHRALEGNVVMLPMPHRIGARTMPDVEAVDMREELKAGNRHVMSRALQDMIRETIKNHEQVILMLNRRGYSTFVMCRSCGHVMKCRFCGTPLVYHRDKRLACHHCDASETVPSVCPECGSHFIKYFGTGTEKLEQELRELIPEARVVRLDRDTTTRKFAHTEILSAFRNGEYDVLLGTQMVAKGHDIPNVTAVGIISADSSLNMPDFRAAERCFMLITQAAGRAGRGEKKGRVIVQCYDPSHYAVTSALKQDYKQFYDEEIIMRRNLYFPPFCRIVKLTFLNEDEEKARTEAERIKKIFAAKFAGEERTEQAIGPAPDIISNFRGVYRFCLMVKTRKLTALQGYMREEGLERRTDVLIDIDPIMI